MTNLNKYYKIGQNGTKWVQCPFDPTKTQVYLYEKLNGEMIFFGIGLY